MKIAEGLVIDHLPAWSSPELLKLLGLQSRASRVCLLIGEKSLRQGLKDILVAEDFAPAPADIQKIAVRAPQATLNYVESGTLVKKFRPTLPPLLEQILLCSNPNCITKAEEVPHKVRVADSQQFPFQCYYCQTRFSHKELEFFL